MAALISVIVPVYKVEKYVHRCIKSIIQQTYHNLEIILIDDGSTDSSPLICDEYAKNDNRIIVVHKPNGGLSDARNVGLARSTGEYVCFIDGDDYIESDYIEVLYDSIKAANADLCICDFRRVDENGNGLLDDGSFIRDELLTKQEFFNRIDSDIGYRYIVAWNKLYTRKAIGNVVFPVGRIHEDEATIHLFANNCETIVAISKPLYCYLSRNDSITGSFESIKKLDYIESLAERIHFYISNENTKPIDTYIRNLILFYYSRRGHFFKKYKKRIEELDTIVKRTISESKTYICSNKTRLAIVFPRFFVLVSRSIHLLKKSWIGSFLSRLFNLFKTKNKTKKFLSNKITKDFITNTNKLILLDVPTHGNLGDHAICETEKSIIQFIFGKNVFEFTHSEWHLYKKRICKYISKEDIIFIPGGGFIGSIWKNEQREVASILKRLKNNNIYIFPQSVFFDNKSNLLKRQFARICSGCKRLTIMVRDSRSYELLKEMGLSNTLKYAPDTVLCYNYQKHKQQKNEKILFCVRDDKEKNILSTDLENKLVEYGYSYDRSSTVLGFNIKADDRKEMIDRKIDEFSRYSLVITDRLHGMIFALLAGTPCIAFDNSYKKVSGVYEWFKDVEGISCITPEDFTISVIKKMYKIGIVTFSNLNYVKLLYGCLKDENTRKI